MISGYENIGSVEFLNDNQNRDWVHQPWEVIEDHFNFDLLDLESVFSCLEGFTELPSQDGEHGFNFISLMILNRVEQQHHSPSIISGDSLSFSIPDRYKRTWFQGIPDQSVDLFRIVPFVHDIEVKLFSSVTLFQEFFCVRDIVNRGLGDLQSGDNLSRSIDIYRGFQGPFSCPTGTENA